MAAPLIPQSSDSCAYIVSSFTSASDPPPNVSILDESLLSVEVPPLLVGSISSTPPHNIVDAAAAALNVRPPRDAGMADPLSILPEQQQQLSTPTMHPKLVNTLKSIICPAYSPTEKDQLLLQPQQDVPMDISFASNVSNFQSIYGSTDLSPSSVAVDTKRDQVCEQKQAAIVPIHMIQNRRPYKCSFNGCNKTFKNPQTLKMHRKTHCSGGGGDVERRDQNGKMLHSLATVPPSCKAGQNKKIPSRCPICKRTFVGLYELRRHFGRKHSEGEKTHACNKCGKRFYIEVDLRDHQKLCGEPLVCKCGMKFAFKCNLVAHKKTHPACQDDPDGQTSQSSQRQAGSSASQQQKSQKQQNKQASASSHRVALSPAVPPQPLPVYSRSFYTASSQEAAVPISEQHFLPSFGQFHASLKTEQMLQCNIWPCFPSTVPGIGRAT